MQKFKELVMPAIALFIICLISAFLLAGTNELTSDRIEQNIQEQKIASRKIVFANAAAFKNESTVEVNGKNVEYTIAMDGAGHEIGYVFTSQAKGYGGTVSVMTAVDKDGKVIKSVVLAMDDETPGLGQNAGKNDFLEQFEGNEGLFSWVKAGGQGNEITGVTSATFTSKAVIECVNDAVSAYGKLGGEK